MGLRPFEYQLATGGDLSADYQSPSQYMPQMYIASIQAKWTGSPTGSLKLQISNNDPNVTAAANIIWSDYTGSTTSVSGPGNFLWNLSSLGFNLIRVVYTYVSGSGSIDITISGKGPA